NTMSISLTKLVEFEDVTKDGYTSDDLVISDYTLNSSTLGEIQFYSNNNSFTISSESDDLFTMIVELNLENGIPYEWKWSIILNYPFTSQTSTLAMLHEINAGSSWMADMHEENHMGDYNLMFEDNHMQDNHQYLPMFFSWDKFAEVDGVTQNVTASVAENVFALSFAQGSSIYYDPKIGVEPTSIAEVDSILGSIDLPEFIDVINSPTALGLIAGSFALVSLAIVAYRSKDN
ncbi:MAG: hypothetical protein ACXAC2_14945, partial [Candidatus Kariarchaeaceae archaeon]